MFPTCEIVSRFAFDVLQLPLRLPLQSFVNGATGKENEVSLFGGHHGGLCGHILAPERNNEVQC